MRWVHLLGLGFVVGMTALGFGVSVALFRWNEIAYPQQASTAAGAPPAAQKGGAAMPPDAMQGQTVFQQKCASCHKIGGGRLVGPDLKGVTQNRQRDWLVKFITAPDQVIASGDPTAQQLLKDYGAPMPNVGVSADQANQLLAYIDFQSGTSQVAAGAQPTAGAGAPAGAPTKAPAGAAPPGGAQGDPNKGKATFDQKCSSCHNIGGGKKVGPDLKGVTAQQSHDWLVNMITQPDKWTSSDPTAQQLLKEYGVQMPNLGISPGDANDVIAYLQQQSGGAAAPPAMGRPLGIGAAGGPAPLMAVAPVALLMGLDSLFAPLFQQPAGNPGQGKTVFDQKCASCHSIGGGKMVGPDLKGVTGQRQHDWLVGFITAPDKVIASGDATAKQLVSEYGMPMPNVGVNQQQAEDILAYIQQQSGGAAPAAQPAAQIQPGNAQNGRALFTGEKRLSAGGPPCIACHTAAGVAAFGGGALGLDLTKEQSKLGTAGIASALKSPSFPAMKEAYQGHAIADAEIADLAGFFVEEDRQQPSSIDWVLFPIAGLIIFVVMVAIAVVPWLGRTRPVRRTLVGGARR
ncbi:MAG TPA: c-type cytochrome [Chloroflexota bacterium]